MTEKKQSAQTIYNERWRDKNKDHQRYLSKRSTARSFIRNDANSADLDELKLMIMHRQDALRAEYHYAVTMGDKIFETTDEGQAKGTAQKWAQESPGQRVIISFDRSSDGQHGYLNPNGYGLHPESWGNP